LADKAQFGNTKEGILFHRLHLRILLKTVRPVRNSQKQDLFLCVEKSVIHPEIGDIIDAKLKTHMSPTLLA